MARTNEHRGALERLLASGQHLKYDRVPYGLVMFERFFSTSKVVFGPPHTFGWVRCSELDTKGLEAWERPDGAKVRLPRGARMARIRGSRGQPILLRQERGQPS